MKRIKLAIVVLFLLMVSSCAMVQQKKFQDIDVTATKIVFENADKEKVKLRVFLRLTNPNNFDVVFTRVESKIYVNDTYLTRAVSARGVVVNGTVENEFVMTIKFRDALTAIKNYDPNEEIECRFDNTIVFNFPREYIQDREYTKKFTLKRNLPSLNSLIQNNFQFEN